MARNHGIILEPWSRKGKTFLPRISPISNSSARKREGVSKRLEIQTAVAKLGGGGRRDRLGSSFLVMNKSAALYYSGYVKFGLFPYAWANGFL